MKKEKCLKCGKKTGTRLCGQHDNKFICPLCCSKDRDARCEGCHYYDKAKIYAATKSNKTKVKHFIAETNEDVENAVDQALIQVDRGNIEKGQFMISELEKKHPRNHSVSYGLGVVHAFKGQYDKAIKYFDKSIDIFPFFLEAHFNKGVSYRKMLDIGNMIKSFQEVVAIGDPDDNIVKQAKSSISDMEQSILQDNGVDLDTFLKGQEIFNQAFSCMEKQKWQKAIDGFEVCLGKIKNHTQSHGNIGTCYANLGQRSLALAAFDRALKIDPNYEPATVNKIAVESLKEGETLASKANCQMTDYYKDYTHKKKSLLKSIFGKITSNR